jgi:hypothetical protein
MKEKIIWNLYKIRQNINRNLLFLNLIVNNILKLKKYIYKMNNQKIKL